MSCNVKFAVIAERVGELYFLCNGKAVETYV